MNRVHRLLALLLIGLLSWTCESKHAWEGRYTGQPGRGSVTLILQDGGKGQWIAEQESTLLRWEERSGALWLHLKTGGVMVARPLPAEQALAIELPAVGSLTLYKANQ